MQFFPWIMKQKICIYLSYLYLILKSVLSEACKCDNYAKKKRKKK